MEPIKIPVITLGFMRFTLKISINSSMAVSLQAFLASDRHASAETLRVQNFQ